jgi:hypothetical protein
MIDILDQKDFCAEGLRADIKANAITDLGIRNGSTGAGP